MANTTEARAAIAADVIKAAKIIGGIFVGAAGAAATEALTGATTQGVDTTHHDTTLPITDAHHSATLLPTTLHAVQVDASSIIPPLSHTISVDVAHHGNTTTAATIGQEPQTSIVTQDHPLFPADDTDQHALTGHDEHTLMQAIQHFEQTHQHTPQTTADNVVQDLQNGNYNSATFVDGTKLGVIDNPSHTTIVRVNAVVVKTDQILYDNPKTGQIITVTETLYATPDMHGNIVYFWATPFGPDGSGASITATTATVNGHPYEVATQVTSQSPFGTDSTQFETASQYMQTMEGDQSRAGQVVQLTFSTSTITSPTASDLTIGFQHSPTGALQGVQAYEASQQNGGESGRDLIDYLEGTGSAPSFAGHVIPQPTANGVAFTRIAVNDAQPVITGEASLGGN